jgi:phage tail P2-like protein
MRLNETEMVKLLPAWMQEDGGDKGLATGCDIISRDAYARLKLLSRWDKIDQLNDAELDEMAWELNIQWYDSTAPIAAKRAVIRNSDRVYSKLGTPYAVEQIVADHFGTGEVREWYQYGGQPHHFKVLSDNPSLVNSNLDLFLKLLRTVKRRSSWLDAILICLTGEMFLYSGMAVRDHTKEVHVMGSDEIHIYHAAVVHDNNRETVSIGTDAAVISD